MDPLSQAIEALRQLMNPPAPASNMAMIRKLVSAEYARLEAPQVISFIGDGERELFERHKDKVQEFLQSPDGCDAWGLLVQAFQSFVDPPKQSEDIPEETSEDVEAE
jgi:hypothetical protein